MPQLIPNIFSTFLLTEEEEIQGSILSINQKAVIQNLIAEAAKTKLELTTNKAEYDDYWKTEAELGGQISALKHLLDSSESSEERIKQYAPQQDSSTGAPINANAAFQTLNPVGAQGTFPIFQDTPETPFNQGN